MDRIDLGSLFLHFLALWFVAVGGPSAILPDIHRYVVDVQHLLTSAQFAEIYTLAQVAPGPNVMYIPLVGWQVGGWAGAAALTLAMLLPSATLTLLIARLYARHPKATAGIAIRRGLTPITIGLLFASGWILVQGANEDWRGHVLTAITVALVLRTSLNPLWLLSVGAAAGMLGLV